MNPNNLIPANKFFFNGIVFSEKFILDTYVNNLNYPSMESISDVIDHFHNDHGISVKIINKDNYKSLITYIIDFYLNEYQNIKSNIQQSPTDLYVSDDLFFRINTDSNVITLCARAEVIPNNVRETSFVIITTIYDEVTLKTLINDIKEYYCY